MKRFFVLICIFAFAVIGCENSSTSEKKDQEMVDQQQGIYQMVQPVHMYDYSIPRDIYQQIYDVTTTKVMATYSIIESMTGVTRYECPSMGYAIPADTSLTNPVQKVHGYNHSATTIEQAEPNGLFSSKNTDGTWVLCVALKTGEVYPVYSEHKVMTFPFIMEKNKAGEWVRADNKPIAFKIKIKNGTGKPKPPVVPNNK